MQTFIVLGIIPGTHIQINFTGWLICSVAIALGVATVLGKRTVQGWMLGLYIFRSVRHRRLNELAL